MREWLLDNAAMVTKVAVWLAYILAGLITWVVLAGLWVAFRPEVGYWPVLMAVAVSYGLAPHKSAGRHHLRRAAA